ncbi:MAG: glutamine synthetase family protein [Pseudomonadota bacterium]
MNHMTAPDTDLYQAFLDEHPALIEGDGHIDLLMPDMNGVMRGKKLPAQDLTKLAKDSVSLPGSMYALDVTGENVKGTGLVWRDGDADRICAGLPHTLALVPWATRPTAQVMITMRDTDDTPMAVEPRNALARVVEKFHQEKQYPVVAIELEFFLLDPTWRLSGEANPTPIGPAAPLTGQRLNTTQCYSMDDLGQFEPVIDDIYAAAKLQGIPATTAIAEYGPGQFEINFNHVKDPLKAADQAILFKRLVKGVAEAHGLEASFMAKLHPDLAGNGMHIHCSIEDENRENIFADVDKKHRAPHFLSAIGGLCQTMNDAMAIFAPHGNSYRRMVPGSYAPMAPHWGYNNRTVAMRVPLGARRVEHRVAGADANPYLVLAAMLAGMHYGMSHDIEPPQPISGNAYERLDSNRAPTWNNSLDDFHDSDFARRYFGERFVKTYMAIKRNELARYMGAVPPIDYDWYLRTT